MYVDNEKTKKKQSHKLKNLKKKERKIVHLRLGKGQT